MLPGTDLAHVLALQQQAWELLEAGRNEEARKACRLALSGLESLPEARSFDRACLLTDLAEIELARQDFGAALAAAESAHAFEEEITGVGSDLDAVRLRLRTLALLGGVRRMLGDYRGAEPVLRDAVTTAQQAFGEKTEELALASNDLAVLYKFDGRFADALPLYQAVLAVVIKRHGVESLEEAMVLHNIAGVLHAAGEFGEAESPARRAWDISCARLGGNDPRTLGDAAVYAAVLDGLARHEEAEAIYRECLTGIQRAFGPEHTEVASVLHNLAAVCEARGKLGEAEQHYRRALAINDRLLGADTLDAALTRNNLGALLIKSGCPEQAQPLLVHAHEILTARLASDHPHVERVRRNLQAARAAASARSGADRSHARLEE
jgi:tetratricopeptide (TPR) repeat protein